MKVVCAGDDFDFHAHEIKWHVAPVNLWKAHGVFLRGDDDLRLPLFGAVDGVQDFLLGKAMMIGEAFGIDEFAAQFHEALLKTFRLRNAAQRRDFFARD